MKSKNSKVKKSTPKKRSRRIKFNSDKHVLECLINEMSYWKTKTNNLHGKAWDLRNMLENREWESSEKKMSLETQHSFILYKERMNFIVAELSEVVKRLTQIANKNV